MNKHIKVLDRYIEELENKALQACILDIHSHETGVLQGALQYMIKDTKNQKLIDTFNQYCAIFNLPKELNRFGFTWSSSYTMKELEKDIQFVTKHWDEVEIEYKNKFSDDKYLSICPITMLAIIKSILLFFRKSKPSKITIQLTNNFIHMKHNGNKNKDNYAVTNMNLSAVDGRLSDNLFLERKVIERYFGEDSFSVWGEGFDDFKLKIKI